MLPLWALHSDQLFVLQTTDLSVVFRESTAITPLVFVLSPGTDPAADLYKFAEEMKFSQKLSAISLGQGQVSCQCPPGAAVLLSLPVNSPSSEWVKHPRGTTKTPFCPGAISPTSASWRSQFGEGLQWFPL